MATRTASGYEFWSLGPNTSISYSFCLRPCCLVKHIILLSADRYAVKGESSFTKAARIVNGQLQAVKPFSHLINIWHSQSSLTYMQISGIQFQISSSSDRYILSEFNICVIYLQIYANNWRCKKIALQMFLSQHLRMDICNYLQINYRYV